MRISFQPVYNFFAPVDGFAEFVVIVSLAAMITLAFMNKLTGSFASALTAIGGLGVIHDNCSAFIAARVRKDKPDGR